MLLINHNLQYWLYILKTPQLINGYPVAIMKGDHTRT